MVINVTRMDIALGTRGDARGCPVALATVRALEKRETYYDGVVVGKYALKLWSPDQPGFKEILLPERVANWIRQFDEDYDVAPIRFSVELSDAVA